MSELLALCEAARARHALGERLYLATVVRVEGSSYRRPGARMLFSSAQWLCGSVSGGCLERDLVARGPWRTQREPAALVTYDSRMEDDESPGLGCGGVVHVLIERLREPPVQAPAEHPDALFFLSYSVAQQRRGASATVYRSDLPAIRPGAHIGRFENGAQFGTLEDERVQRDLDDALQDVLLRGRSMSYRSRDGSVEALLEFVAPPPHLFVFGSGRDALPVVTLARELGWEVTVCDRRERLETRQRFAHTGARLVVAEPAEVRPLLDRCARALAVVMSHDFLYDREALGALLASSARYIGVLGPRHRTTRIFEELSAQGRGPGKADAARVHTPAGLALGAETPMEIGLSIVAELQATLAGQSARPLRERRVLHEADRYPHLAALPGPGP